VADASVFAWTCEALEQVTSLDRLALRGSVRLALKKTGLDAARVRPEEIRVVLERILPAELEACGVGDAREICAALAEQAGRKSFAATPPGSEAPEDIFRRLAGKRLR
jgi:hypothetical protein